MDQEELKRLLLKTTADVKQTAAAIGFSEKTVRKGIRDETIPCVKFGPRKYRVPTTWIAEKLGAVAA
ncbi:hypothetical protein SAMN02799625_04673 [Methylobacterium sp. UNC300MFChir4.1]|uniref:hypothetical protein n=1 Tax=Methylobacterium sp. UNC300MFChir4.1 TaxID=1502747 RepID=UPI0008AB1859|nr:hypothetical protein [Methylobacterium sp. UNC300MFChir4.1]SEP09929.1 hypothetical protein SAMN02799625_04673 [Methylobacterium sp. UNC300MFChir4.1]